MDIIVTTPKGQMAAAAQEAADCIRDGGGEYFRRFPHGQAPTIAAGDRVYYVEDGFVRGFAVVKHIDDLRDPAGRMCDSTGRAWGNGIYVVMRASSWQWIRPIPMKGFQGFRYAGHRPTADGIARMLIGDVDGDANWAMVLPEGGWRDPRPRSCRVCGCTDRYGCPLPGQACHWVEEDLCSACSTNPPHAGGR